MAYEPTPDHRFSFGLWTVGHPGFDPFGDPVREVLPPVALVELLAEVGAYGVNFHDNDLVPIDADAHERDQIVAEFRKALDATGLVVPMATTNLFRGLPRRRLHRQRPGVRAYAISKTMRAIDLGVELGATVYVFWGGREGVETDSAKDPLVAFARWRGDELPVRVRARPGLRLGSRSSPSRTSPAATSTCRPPAPCLPSSRPSITRRWSG